MAAKPAPTWRPIRSPSSGSAATRRRIPRGSDSPKIRSEMKNGSPNQLVSVHTSWTWATGAPAASARASAPVSASTPKITVPAGG